MLWIHTHICNFTRLSCLNTVFTLKSMPTVLTNADVNESSAYLKRNDVFPTLLLPIINSLNMQSKFWSAASFCHFESFADAICNTREKCAHLQTSYFFLFPFSLKEHKSQATTVQQNQYFLIEKHSTKHDQTISCMFNCYGFVMYHQRKNARHV